MQQTLIRRSFDSWRTAARRLLVDSVPPEQTLWLDDTAAPTLPGISALEADPVELPISSALRVPRDFLALAKMVACHRDSDRWSLLYRMLWRITHDQPALLEHLTDDDVYRAHAMEKAVSRDRHKMTAFVRFRRIESVDGEQYVAFHRPDHFIVRLTAPFFKDRFAAMRWTILTPDDSVSWDGDQLCFTPGVPASSAPAPDALEDLWRTYYANIFNPARIKLNAMRKEMPIRHWKTLPETQLIPDLLRDAPKRVEQMIKTAKKNAATSTSSPHTTAASACDSTGTAADFVPAHFTLPQLREASNTCRGCEIYCTATQVVFGEGPAHAQLIFVGEQPGDQEDLQGRPFVGPAGQLFNDVLRELGLDREQTYVTNAVKHFKFEQRGKRRLHSTPSAREVTACKPWLEAEITAIKPAMIVALGATAARALFGNQFRVTHQRGERIESPYAKWCMATIHPSAILRTPADQRDAALAGFREDLRIAVTHFHEITKAA